MNLFKCFGLLLFSSVSAFSWADFVIYDQAPTEVIEESNSGIISDLVVHNGFGHHRQAFEDFVLEKESVVNTVFWAGDTNLNAPESEKIFQISFHEDNPSEYRQPYVTPFATFTVVAEETHPVPNARSFTSTYSVDLPEPVELNSHTTYWISISAVIAEGRSYAWSWRTWGNMCCLQSYRIEDGSFSLNAGESVFSLIGLYQTPALADTDGDSVYDEYDVCPDTPAGLSVNADGCALVQLDEDQDGVASDIDQCPHTLPGVIVDVLGCDDTQLDGDSDGVADAYDLCPDTVPGATVDLDGCALD